MIKKFERKPDYISLKDLARGAFLTLEKSLLLNNHYSLDDEDMHINDSFHTRIPQGLVIIACHWSE